MTPVDKIKRLRTSWQSQKASDEELKDAWINISNMMFKGNITALIGAAKLIAQMDWWNGITEWIDFTPEQYPIVSKSIHIEERSLYAYVIMYCKHLANQRSNTTWMDTTGAELDWGMMAISAGSVPTLGEIPDWLMEPLMIGCLREVQIPHEEISQEFWMLAFPITQALFEAISEENPSMSMGLLHPVDSISWYDAVHFSNRLSEAMGYDPVYTIKGTNITITENANGYRLPTATEWITAARHNGKPQWPFAGHNELWMVGVYDANASDHVGRNIPTPAGLYDMSGNIWEWCWSDDSRYATRKGGSWMSKEEACAVDWTSKRLKTFAGPAQGLRLCRIEKTAEDTPNIEVDDWEW